MRRRCAMASQQIQADGNKLQIEAMRLNPRSPVIACTRSPTAIGCWARACSICGANRNAFTKSVRRRINRSPSSFVPLPQNIYAEIGTRVVVTAVNEGAAAEAELVVLLDGTSWQVVGEVEARRRDYLATRRVITDRQPSRPADHPSEAWCKTTERSPKTHHSIFVVGREQLVPGVKTVTASIPRTNSRHSWSGTA